MLLCTAQLGLLVAFVSTLIGELGAAPAVALPAAHAAPAWLAELMLMSVVSFLSEFLLRMRQRREARAAVDAM